MKDEISITQAEELALDRCKPNISEVEKYVLPTFMESAAKSHC